MAKKRDTRAKLFFLINRLFFGVLIAVAVVVAKAPKQERAKRKIRLTFVFTMGLLCFLSIGPGMEQLCVDFLKSVTTLKAHP